MITLQEIPITDSTTLSLARALEIARDEAQSASIDLAECCLIIVQDFRETGVVWRISYARKDYVRWRGGSFEVDVEAETGKVLRAQRGQ